jgi:DNA-binding response OmpR family regulator
MRPGPETAPATVVLIEDDAAVQCLLREALEAAGFKVQAFAYPFQALASMRRTVPSVLVLDWHLPEMSGRAVIDFARHTMEALPPVLVVTGDLQLQAPSDVAEVVRKPVSIARFVERVRELASSGARSAQTRTG